MANKGKKYVAIYARQSVDKKDSVSIETQIEDCKTCCALNGTLGAHVHKHRGLDRTVSIKKFAAPDPGEMGFRVVDNCAEEHQM